MKKTVLGATLLVFLFATNTTLIGMLEQDNQQEHTTDSEARTPPRLKWRQPKKKDQPPTPIEAAFYNYLLKKNKESTATRYQHAVRSFLRQHPEACLGIHQCEQAITKYHQDNKCNVQVTKSALINFTAFLKQDDKPQLAPSVIQTKPCKKRCIHQSPTKEQPPEPIVNPEEQPYENTSTNEEIFTTTLEPIKWPFSDEENNPPPPSSPLVSSLGPMIPLSPLPWCH